MTKSFLRHLSPYFYAAILLLLSACASTPELGRVRNSELSNLNPAPASMSPPPQSVDDVVDPTYVRTQADYHFALGESLSLDGEAQKAIEEFKLAMVYDPDSVSVKLRLASEYLRAGLTTEALELAESGLETDPKHTDTHIFVGGIYQSMRMFDEAEKHYMAVLQYEPKNEDVLLYLGALYAEQDKPAEAKKYFMQAANLPDAEKSHLAYYYMAKLEMMGDTKDPKAAMKNLNEALKRKPDFEEGVLSLYDLYEARGEQEKGLVLLESFQRQFGPKKSIANQLSQVYLEREEFDKAYAHLKVLESFDPNNLTVKVKMALILIDGKKLDDAIVKLEEILALAPSSDKIRYYLAAVYEEKENTKLAVVNYKKIESSSTYYPDAMVRAANLMRMNNNVKGALDLLAEAVQQRDDSATLYAYYASLLDETRDYKPGIAILEKALKKFPDNTQLHFYLGSLKDKVGDTEECIAEMRKVIALDSNHVQALNYLAYTLAETKGDLNEAEQMAIRALDLQPNDGYILDTVGWVYFKKGQVEEAIRYLEAAYTQKQNESVVAEHLGDAYYVYELVDKAKEMYQRAVSLENDEKKASRIRAKIVAIQKGLQDNRQPASADVSGR